MKKRRSVRVTWEEVEGGSRLTFNADTFTQTREFCLSCGKQGTWTNADLIHRVCTACGTIARLDRWMQPARGEGLGYDSFWGPITRQLQLAEAGTK